MTTRSFTSGMNSYIGNALFKANKGFLKIVLVLCILMSPFKWDAVNRQLQRFAQQITRTWRYMPLPDHWRL